MENKRSRGKNRQQKTPVQSILPTIKVLAIFVFLGLVIWGFFSSNSADLFKVEVHWDIDKTLPIEQQKLNEKIQPLIQDKYQLDLHEIKLVLESEPWVSEVHIERLLWNSIQIKVRSHQIAMRWEDVHCKSKDKINCVGYISDQGKLFIPKIIIPSDAVLMRSKPKQAIVNHAYTDFQHYQSSIAPMVIKTFSKTNIDQLTLEPNVKVVLGYQKQKERLERFLKAYKKLEKKRSKVKRATFDMRYPKGFALSY